MQRSTLFLSVGLPGLLLAGLVVAFAMQSDDPALPPSPTDGANVPSPTVPKDQDPKPFPLEVPKDAVRVRLTVIDQETYVAPPPVRVEAVRAGDGTPLSTWLLAGAGAGFDAPSGAAGITMAVVEHDEGRVLRQVVLAAECVRPALAGRQVVRGSVLGPDRKPVAGATVWFGEFDTAGARREVAVAADGTYEVPVLASSGVPFVVRAPGHATQWRAIVVQVPPPACDAVLERACAVEMQIAGIAVSMQDARVFVVPRSIVSTGLGQWPFFLQGLSDGYALEANGRVVIDDLPASGEVGLVIRHPRAAMTAPTAVVLKGERVRASVPVQFATDEWAAVVVDEHGAPRPGVMAFVSGQGTPLATGNSQRLVPPHLELRGSLQAITDATGRFAVGEGPRENMALHLRGAGCAGRNLTLGAFDPTQPIVLPTWIGGEPELRVQPPRAGVVWIAECDLGGGVREVLAADAAFRVSLPHAGRFDVVVTTFVGEQEVASERRSGLHATGPIDVPVKRLP